MHYGSKLKVTHIPYFFWGGAGGVAIKLTFLVLKTANADFAMNLFLYQALW